MKSSLHGAILWGFFVFACYGLIAFLFAGPELFRAPHELGLTALGFCAVSFLGAWLVPRLSGAAKLMSIATGLGLGISIRAGGDSAVILFAVMVVATTTARVTVDLFFPRAHWSQTQLWTALLSGPVAFVMLVGTKPRANVAIEAGLAGLVTMSLALAAVAPRRWVED